MRSIDELFARTREEDRAALVGYLPAGFPDLKTSIAAIEAMVDGGVDLVEVGLPYSDPVMDGPVIQAAADRALAGGLAPLTCSTSCEPRRARVPRPSS